mmetsp:Transcript_12826/g.36028  ORF Transcript_12826/g.36028 Transcript_12826/m.36028 type:complete len:238 (+) Transcript_12826:892-1605(+)
MELQVLALHGVHQHGDLCDLCVEACDLFPQVLSLRPGTPQLAAGLGQLVLQCRRGVRPPLAGARGWRADLLSLHQYCLVIMSLTDSQLAGFHGHDERRDVLLEQRADGLCSLGGGHWVAICSREGLLGFTQLLPQHRELLVALSRCPGSGGELSLLLLKGGVELGPGGSFAFKGGLKLRGAACGLQGLRLQLRCAGLQRLGLGGLGGKLLLGLRQLPAQLLCNVKHILQGDLGLCCV